MFAIRHPVLLATFFCGWDQGTLGTMVPEWRKIGSAKLDQLFSISVRVFGDREFAEQLASEIGGEVVELQEALVIH